MTGIPVSQDGRFNDFTEDERDVIHFALQQCAKRIMDKAAADLFPPAELGQAAGMYHLAATLASEVGVTVGEEASSSETLEVVAVCIAEGEAPFAARMAAEAEGEAPEVGLRLAEMSAPLGAHADVAVTPEEDEAA